MTRHISFLPFICSWAISSAALAQVEPREWGVSHERGFSYFMGVGQQASTYTEHAELVRARSTVSTRSAVLMTGALYAVHPDFLFSLDNSSNFAPGTSTESWFATSGTMPYAASPNVIEDRPVNGPLLQQNRFSLSQNLTRLLAHVRAQDAWFLLGGVNFHAQSYKRFGFKVLQPDVVNAPADRVVEESTSEVLLEAGLALESERVKHADRHYSLRFSMAKPIWRRLDNTAWPDVSFAGTSGWDARLEGRYSVAIHELVHVGGWAQYLYAQRGSQIRGAYELPLTHTRSVAFGLEVLWKL